MTRLLEKVFEYVRMIPVPLSGLSCAPENSLVNKAQLLLQPRLVQLSRQKAKWNAWDVPKFWSIVKPTFACLVGRSLTCCARLLFKDEKPGVGILERRVLERALKQAVGITLPGKGFPGAGAVQPAGI